MKNNKKRLFFFVFILCSPMLVLMHDNALGQDSLRFKKNEISLEGSQSLSFSNFSLNHEAINFVRYISDNTYISLGICTDFFANKRHTVYGFQFEINKTLKIQQKLNLYYGIIAFDLNDRINYKNGAKRSYMQYGGGINLEFKYDLGRFFFAKTRTTPSLYYLQTIASDTLQVINSDIEQKKSINKFYFGFYNLVSLMFGLKF